VWTGHRVFGLHQLIDQPLHLFFSERHVDLDRRLARKRSGYLVAYVLKREAAPLALDYSNNLLHKRDHVGGLKPGGRGLYCDGPTRQLRRLDAYSFQLFADYVERLDFGAAEAEGFGYEEGLNVRGAREAYLSKLFKQHTLVSHVLIDEQESFLVGLRLCSCRESGRTA